MVSGGEKLVFNWSGGKDSALALYKVIAEGKYHVHSVLTTLTAGASRISMHGVRESLLDAQARSIKIPLVKLFTPEMPSMENYENALLNSLQGFIDQGVTTAAFGDIFLEDLRKYREKLLQRIGMATIFPLWNIPSRELIEEFMDLGFRAVVVCVDDRVLDRSFAGRLLDRTFIDDLPSNVDPCGENGEFHTFVFDGPLFSSPISFTRGEIFHRNYLTATTSGGFWYCDLIPS